MCSGTDGGQLPVSLSIHQTWVLSLKRWKARILGPRPSCLLQPPYILWLSVGLLKTLSILKTYPFVPVVNWNCSSVCELLFVSGFISILSWGWDPASALEPLRASCSFPCTAICSGERERFPQKPGFFCPELGFSVARDA